MYHRDSETLIKSKYLERRADFSTGEVENRRNNLFISRFETKSDGKDAAVMSAVI